MEKLRRLAFEEWFMQVATTVSLRADCSRRKVGAVLVNPDNSIVATGYNGAPAGKPGCLSGACPRAFSQAKPGSSYDTGPGSCIALHAEQNALLRASWEDMRGSTLYVTEEPCGGCSRMISGTPISRVVWPGGGMTC